MKRTVSILLLLSMLAGMTISGASCKETTDSSDTSNSDAVSTTAPSTLEVKDFGSYNIRILTRADTGTGTWFTVDVTSDEMNGEVINDAVFMRNEKIEETYNVTFERISEEGTDHVNLVTQSVLAGDDTYDLVLSYLQNQASIASEGYVFDLNSLESLDLTNSCWDIVGNSCLEVNGKMYFVMGDVNITDNDATYSTLFNKEIAASFPDMPDLYQLVKDGSWTLDKLKEFSIMVTDDVDGNGIMEWDKDRYGLISQYEVGIAMLLGSGQKTVEIGSDGFLSYNLNNEKIVNAFELIYNFFADQSYQLIADAPAYANVTDLWNTLARGGFKAGRALFYIGPIANVRLIRDMEADFGILPVPKLTEDQDKYYSMLQAGNATAYSIPVTVSDPERSALILEALCEGSTGTLLPAYYENTLVRKASRDTESGDMLDLIFENRIIDFSNAFLSIGINSFILNTLKSATNTFVSSEASQRTKFVDNIETINEAFSAQ